VASLSEPERAPGRGAPHTPSTADLDEVIALTPEKTAPEREHDTAPAANLDEIVAIQPEKTASPHLDEVITLQPEKTGPANLDEVTTPPPEMTGAEMARRDAATLREVCRRDAVVDADPGWIELRMRADQVRLDIRRAGLDLDPGWVPWLGVVVRYVYE
jgi:hypothetical protein